MISHQLVIKFDGQFEIPILKEIYYKKYLTVYEQGE